MEKSTLDFSELEQTLSVLPNQFWCTHPNGTSVWTGREYADYGSQDLVCNSSSTQQCATEHMEFIAAFNPAVVRELMERALLGLIWEWVTLDHHRAFEPPVPVYDGWYAVVHAKGAGASATADTRLLCLVRLWRSMDMPGLRK